jgi:Protein of unknown function (DUF3300)
MIVMALLAMLAWSGASAAQDAVPLPQGQLDAVLAPVALYPDALLAPLLMATTYPDELIAADQWRRKTRNAALKGEALAGALTRQPWAPSVKALVPFPEVLDMLALRPVWMNRIGGAFLAQPAAAVREIQRLRRLALATGKLKSSRRLLVTERGPVVAITPLRPDLVYVPIYNPAVVFGVWAYPSYPPVYIQPPPRFEISGPGMESGIGFSRVFRVAPELWGWAHLVWGAGAVTIDIALFNRINRYAPPISDGTWRHAAHPTGYFQIPERETAAHARRERDGKRGVKQEHRRRRPARRHRRRRHD